LFSRVITLISVLARDTRESRLLILVISVDDRIEETNAEEKCSDSEAQRPRDLGWSADQFSCAIWQASYKEIRSLAKCREGLPSRSCRVPVIVSCSRTSAFAAENRGIDLLREEGGRYPARHSFECKRKKIHQNGKESSISMGNSHR